MQSSIAKPPSSRSSEISNKQAPVVEQAKLPRASDAATPLSRHVSREATPPSTAKSRIASVSTVTTYEPLSVPSTRATTAVSVSSPLQSRPSTSQSEFTTVATKPATPIPSKPSTPNVPSKPSAPPSTAQQNVKFVPNSTRKTRPPYHVAATVNEPVDSPDNETEFTMSVEVKNEKPPSPIPRANSPELGFGFAFAIMEYCQLMFLRMQVESAPKQQQPMPIQSFPFITPTSEVYQFSLRTLTMLTYIRWSTIRVYR